MEIIVLWNYILQLYPVYTTNRRRAGLVNAHQLVRFRQMFAFTLQQREQD